MSNLIWRPVCPLCDHPKRRYIKTVQTTCHLTVHPDGQVTIHFPDLLMDLIGSGLHPDDIYCAHCQR